MKYSLYILLLILFSCSTQNKMIKTQRHSWNYNNWKQDFKDRVLCNCLIKGYSNKNITSEIYEIDKSYYNPIAVALYDSVINEVLKKEVLIMKNDSLNSINKVTEAAAGKTVFNHCIKLYRSKKIDSIVKRESEKWGRIKNIDSLVAKSIPNF